MRKIILAIITIPLAIILVAFDVFKIPIAIMLVPIIIFLTLIDGLKGDYIEGEFWGILGMIFFVGTSMYLDMVWDIDWP